MPNLTYSKTILASVAEHGGPICSTLEIKFPRFILPEFNTHRMFSRNFQSTRAYPTNKLAKLVRSEMYVPEVFGKNMPGMQAKEDLTGWRAWTAKVVWKVLGHISCSGAWLLHKLGVHKQHAGRVLEPYSYITGVVTATEWNNFLALRDHPDAQPEIQDLARKMRTSLETQYVQVLKKDEWHLPYTTYVERAHYPGETLLKMSSARCARASYLNLGGGNTTLEKDVSTYNKLVHANPPHLSPVEHQAQVGEPFVQSGNFTGWVQHRKLLETSGA